MVRIVTLSTNRSEYDVRDAAECSMTVGELIEELRGFNEDYKVVFMNDNGYTYGYVNSDDVDVVRVETREEEEERERKEEEEATMEELRDELTDLQARYENPIDDSSVITDEEYREEREAIFNTYGVTEEEYNNWVNNL